MIIRSPGLALSAIALLGACAPLDSPPPDLRAEAFLRVVAAEDARPAGGPELDVLLEAAHHGAAWLRAVGVRALGRLEEPDLSGPIGERLDDPDPSVRAAAADALAQTVHGSNGSAVLSPLLHRARQEEDPVVRGVLARSLGRLSLTGERRREVGRALLALSRGPRGAWPSTPQMLGVALGMESFLRGSREAVPAALVARLGAMVTYPSDDPDAPRVREVSVLALTSRGLLGPGRAARAMDDLDVRVRRAAAASLVRMSPEGAATLVERALRDREPRVRLEGVRALAAAHRDASRCARLLTLATDDPDTAVRLVALDGLDRPCPDPASQIGLLDSVAASLPPAPSVGWHDAVHALASLAAVTPGRAEPLLGRFAGYPDPFVRTWAARAAAAVGDGALLRELARDVDANVRAAALEGLGGMAGSAADSLLVTALARDDAPQVILALVPRLRAVTDPRRRSGALAAALATLDRLSRKAAETSRDPRLHLLELVEALGDSTTVDAVEPYLRDFDPAVARRAAAALERWTGKRYLAAPRNAPRLPLPSAGQLRAMERATLVLHMLRGGDVEIRLWPWVAPTNAFRLYEMVRTHALDGLTFHRVVPNFVIQGGSPGANEYAGHGAFTRDEVGLPVQWRGTVGVSTRGRDTGDGQIYVNLVDNVRLDHDYTILGEVVSGMNVVDAILEGDVIRGTDVRMEP